jgi:hypothetical protein
MATTEQFVGLHAQMNEIMKRIGNDSLEPGAVKRALQDIIEGKVPPLTWQPPAWWPGYDRQMARARQLWGDIQLPEPPANFVPQTKTEVPLLHVPQPFDELWNVVPAPAGYTTWRWPELKSDKRNLRLAPNVPNCSEPVWLAFDPEHGRGERPDKFWGQPNLAASEVFSALIQFPDWPLSWFNGASAPNLAGYQFKYDGSWSVVPCVSRWGSSRRLKLSADWAVSAVSRWASPSVREC